MDIRLTEAQVLLQQTLDRFLAERCSLDRVRELEAGDGHDPAVWGGLAELGALGVLVPEEHGGLGGTFVEAAICCEAIGAALYPSPFVWSCVVAPFLLASTQAAGWLPRIAAGDALLALADDAAHDPAAVRPTAISDGDSYRLQGAARFVEYARQANGLMVVAEGPAGPALFLVTPGDAGLALERRREISSGQLYRVVFSHQGGAVSGGPAMASSDGTPAAHLRPVVDARPSATLPALDEAYDRARVALAARMVGSAQRAFDTTLRYTRERSQFGQPLLNFQAIHFRLATLLAKIDAARLLTYNAAWLIDQGRPFRLAALQAKASASDVYREMAGEAVQLHGGFGFTEEANPQLFYRRAAVDAALLGTSAALRDRAAELLFDGEAPYGATGVIVDD